MKRLITIVITLMCAALMLCSCKKSVEETPNSPMPEKMKTVLIDSTLPPAVIKEETSAFSGISTIYPIVNETNADGLINNRINARLSEFAGEYSSAISSITYEIKYNAKGVLSMLFSAKTESGLVTQLLPLNFNTAGGDEIQFSALFDDKDDSWREVAAFYMDAEAKLRKMNTYSEITVTGDMMFYLTDKSLFIVYEMYEISYYSAGSPTFEIPYGVLEKYFSKTGAVFAISR